MKLIFNITFCLTSYFVFSQNVINSNLDFSKTKLINPNIYGYNQDQQHVNDPENWKIRRLGGNRLSVFNWENGASNSGHDNITFTNDNRIPSLLAIPWNNKDNAGEVYRFFHQENLDAGIGSIITFPIQGWVASDKLGSNLTSPPSARWDELVFEKGSTLNLSPDLNDGKVYLDESFNFLLQEFGESTTQNGVKYIALGNEPALWDNTHEYIQPNPPTISEYISKLISAAKVIKTLDPNVKIIFGEFAGINIYDFSNAVDWVDLKDGYDWFPSFLLDTLKKESDIFGQPLIDYFSFHFYPQHKVDGNGDFSPGGTVVRNSKSTQDYIRETRMDFSRSLWDDTYLEPSWLTNSKLNGEPNKILTRLQKSIDAYFPSTKLMIGEFDFGFDNDISHAIAIADFLGMAGQNNLSIATRWDLDYNNGSTYTNTAYKLFRNYDGSDASFGSSVVYSTFDNKGDGSVWASLNSTEDELHLIILNKDVDDKLVFNINTNDLTFSYTFKELYCFKDGSKSIFSLDADTVNIVNQSITGEMEPLTVYHLVLNRTSIITGVNTRQVKRRIQVYPNPAQDLLFIENMQIGEELTISDAKGKLIIKTQYKGKAISISNLTSGFYFLKVEQETIQLFVK